MNRVARLSCLVLAAFAGFAETRVKLPSSRADLANGQKLFSINCALCHGPKGEGGRGPLLAQLKLRRAPDDAALVKVIQDGIRGTEMPGADTMSEHEVRQTAAYVRSLGKIAAQPVPGNAAHGAEVFRGKGGCVSCHAIHGEGGIVGPDLAAVGAARSASFLHQTLVDPKKSIPEGYLLVTVVSKAGESASGLRLNEDSFSIQIRDGSGAVHSFWKSDIERIDRQKGVTPMPSYEGKLTADELTDVVCFLASLKESK
jgi:cytochrome c oxidase cbb3-type subunit 3